MGRVRRRSDPGSRTARTELEGREAVERLAGEDLGRTPQLWIIRETLDCYTEALRRAWSQPRHPQTVEPVHLCTGARGHAYQLVRDFESGSRSTPVREVPPAEAPEVAHGKQPASRPLDPPNAALAIWNATRGQLAEVVWILQAIEGAEELLGEESGRT